MWIAFEKDEQRWHEGSVSGNFGGWCEQSQSLFAAIRGLERKTKFKFNSNFNSQNLNLSKKNKFNIPT